MRRRVGTGKRPSAAALAGFSSAASFDSAVEPISQSTMNNAIMAVTKSA